MIYKICTVLAILIFSFAFNSTEAKKNHPVEVIEETAPKVSIEEEIVQLYDVFSANNMNLPNLESFRNGILGYTKLADKNLIKKEILTIIDFSLSSTQERMWVLDMKNHKVLFHTVVAHGRNTGGEFATKFSNKVNSLQSSLGFYVTGETYIGKNGLSLFIDGMEEEFNSRARERYVVIHGAEYANPDFAAKIGRLGRSLGCPAVPTAVTKEIIDTIKNKSVLYIHSTDKTYASNSKMIQV